MAVVDTLFFGTVGVGLVLGLVRGFLSQVTGLLGLLGGGYLAWRYSADVRAAILDPYLTSDHNREIAFGLILLGTILVVAIVGWGIRRIFEKLEMGAYDRLMGALFGALKAALICAGIMVGIVALAHDGGEIERAIGASRAGPWIWDGVERASAILPEDVRGDVREFLRTHHLPPGSSDETDPARDLRIPGGGRG